MLNTGLEASSLLLYVAGHLHDLRLSVWPLSDDDRMTGLLLDDQSTVGVALCG